MSSPTLVEGFRRQDLVGVLRFLQDKVGTWDPNVRKLPEAQIQALLEFLQSHPVSRYTTDGTEAETFSPSAIRKKLRVVAAKHRAPGKGVRSKNNDVYDLFHVEVANVIEAGFLTEIGFETCTTVNDENIGREQTAGPEMADRATQKVATKRRRTLVAVSIPNSFSSEAGIDCPTSSPQQSPLTEYTEDEDGELKPKKKTRLCREDAPGTMEEETDFLPTSISTSQTCLKFSSTGAGMDDVGDNIVVRPRLPLSLQNVVLNAENEAGQALAKECRNSAAVSVSNLEALSQVEAPAHHDRVPKQQEAVNGDKTFQQATDPGELQARRNSEKQAIMPRKSDTCSSYGLRLDQGDDAIQRAMRLIFRDVMLAAELYMKSHNVQEAAPANVVYKPEVELEVLYATVLGSNWRGRLVELQDAEKPYFLSTRELLTGLIGAAVHLDVLSVGLPWDVQYRMQTAFKDYELDALKSAHQAQGCETTTRS